MAQDLSIYAVALEWLRVPAYLLPAIIGMLFLLGLVLLGSSRVANIKTKQEATHEASRRIAQIKGLLDVALRELTQAVPARQWEPPEFDPGTRLSASTTIASEIDEECRRLIDDLSRICDAHLPELRQSVLDVEERFRDFAQQRLDISARRDEVTRLEADLSALSEEELRAIAERRPGQGWGETFDDPMRTPMAQRTALAMEAEALLDSARTSHEQISQVMSELLDQLTPA